MHLKRIISAAVLAAGLSLGLLAQAMPAASAAPATHTTAVVQTQVTGPTIGSMPLIKWSACSGTSTTWVTLTLFEMSGGSIFNWCFGYTGTWTFSNQYYYISHFCSGNNSGSFSYTVNGVTKGFSFGPGRQVNLGTGPNKPKSLTITGWSGSYRCTL
jgi:hypothetical protein